MRKPGGWCWLEASPRGPRVGQLGPLTAWGPGARVGVRRESRLAAVAPFVTGLTGRASRDVLRSQSLPGSRRSARSSLSSVSLPAGAECAGWGCCCRASGGCRLALCRDTSSRYSVCAGSAVQNSLDLCSIFFLKKTLENGKTKQRRKCEGVRMFRKGPQAWREGCGGRPGPPGSPTVGRGRLDLRVAAFSEPVGDGVPSGVLCGVRCGAAVPGGSACPGEQSGARGR